MKIAPLTQLTDDLVTRLSRAYVSNLAPSNPALRKHLLEKFSGAAGTPGSLFASPVVQGKFPYLTVDTTLSALGGKLLHPDTVAALDKSKVSRLPRETAPYTHQLESWHELIEQRKSVIVTSGTGSGKTECFMVPILDDLARQADGNKDQLVGVQALFLYPLNALIASQRDRLSAWTAHWGSQVRFCLYNGETPNDAKPIDQQQTPQQVVDRKTLRKSPPPILVTNATMLEYLLVRPQDAAILKASQGKLKYIVLDEAHSYLGSQAAEIALLLRRVLDAFGVKPEDVQFIATSATIEAKQADGLLDFLADLSGQSRGRVVQVEGKTTKSDLPLPYEAGWPALPDAAPGLSPEVRMELWHQALVASKPAQWLREQVFAKPRTLAALLEHAQTECSGWPHSTEQDLLAALDAASEAKLPGENGDVFLPFRLHLFGRTQPGLWACVNQDCPGSFATIEEGGARDWAFGAVFVEKRERCSHEDCKGLVLPLVLCRSCGGEHLQGEHAVTAETRFITPPHAASQSDDADDDEEDGTDQEETADTSVVTRKTDERLLAPVFLGQTDGVISMDPTTGAYDVPSGQRVQRVLSENDCLPCARCGQSETPTRKLFLPSFISVPFALSVTAPTVLEALPEADENAAALPFGGRRLLTFTDSRQGTARFAARLQQDAETRWVRSVTFQTVLACGSGHNPQDALDLAKYEQLPQEFRTAFADTIANLRARISAPPTLPVEDLVRRMTGEPEMLWLHKQREEWAGYERMSPHMTARMMFWREFGRRPARQTSLETLGLIALRYPFLNQVHNPPFVWKQWKGTPSEWQDYLKLCIDFVIRANSCVDIDPRFQQWLGTDIRARGVCPPGAEPGSLGIRWPRVSQQGALPRLAQLLMRAFELPEDGSTRADIANILNEAFDAIRTAGKNANVFQANAVGEWQINLEKVELVVPTKAWICPVTRRILDTTLRGHTPYVPRNRNLSTKATPVTLPTPPIAGRNRLADGSPAVEGELRAWVEQSETVAAARNAGAWTEFSDRIVMGQRYFRVAEHTAQIPRRELEETERLFKAGAQNILASSTTMEMGIDIGGLSGVAMTNAPPSPSNFLQRAGRAGRRGESRAISLTICRPMPHDNAVFRNPTWPFTTPMYVPSVQFESQSLVQRHVNAMCLGYWLVTKQGDATKLPCDRFFCADGASPSQAEAFAAALRSGALLPTLTNSVMRLVAGTCLGQQSAAGLFNTCAENVIDAARGFLAMREPLVVQKEAYSKGDDDKDSALKAITIALKRLDGEYLLSFLVERQVLPGHGFPTGIVQFNSVTKDRVDHQRTLNAGTRSEDNRLEGTSRPIEVALREFAPDVDVVIRGLSYKSRGVLLNWHARASEQGDERDVQAIRWLVECDSCEHVENLPTRPSECPNCKHSLVRTTEFLIPAGFAVDFMDEPNTDLSDRGYVPVPPPRAFAGTATPTRLGRPGLLDYRYAANGHLTTLCSGLHEKGYALCLHCGRAESETSKDPKSSSPLVGHKALRRGKAVTNPLTHKCTGNDNPRAVKRHLNLGASRFTDVLELRFLDEHGYALKDREIASTLAFALRTALAEELGIEESELGVAEGPKSASGGLSVFLFDNATGGAGFCGEAVERLPRLLATVRRNLERCDCERACHKCLLTFSTQSMANHVNRQKTLTYLTDERLHAAQPDGLPRVAGADLQLMWEDGICAIERLTRRHSGAELHLFAHGAASTLDLSAWRGLELLRTLPKTSVTLELPVGLAGKLDWQQAQQLAALASIRGVTLVERSNQPELAGQKVAAQVVLVDRVYTICMPTSAAELGPDWLSPRSAETGFIATSPASLVSGMATPVEADGLKRSPPAALRELRFEHQLNGGLTTLGVRFWQLIQTESPNFLGTGPLREVVYTDRYLTSPAAGAIIWRILRWLVDNGRTDTSTVMRVRTAPVDSNRQRRPSHDVSDDFPSVESQTGVLKMMHMPERLGTKCGVDVVPQRMDLPHHRSLKVVHADGTTSELRLDQGIGFLKLSGSWDERLAAPTQADRLVKGTWEVWKQHQHAAVGYLLG